jgi:hypothetical protein
MGRDHPVVLAHQPTVFEVVQLKFGLFGRRVRIFLGIASDERARVRARQALEALGGIGRALPQDLFAGTRVRTNRGELWFRSNKVIGLTVEGRPSATAAFVQELNRTNIFEAPWPRPISYNRVTHRLALELGAEHDAALHDAIGQVLREFGAEKLRSRSFLAGSQVIDVNRFRVRGRRIKLVSETYAGTILYGPKVLIEDVAARMRQRTDETKSREPAQA